MFRRTNLVLLASLFLSVFTACETLAPKKPGPPPSPIPAAVTGWRLTLMNPDGTAVAKTYDIGRNDIISEDLLHRRLTFRYQGQTIVHKGSWTKARL